MHELFVLVFSLNTSKYILFFCIRLCNIICYSTIFPPLIIWQPKFWRYTATLKVSNVSNEKMHPIKYIYVVEWLKYLYIKALWGWSKETKSCDEEPIIKTDEKGKLWHMMNGNLHLQTIFLPMYSEPVTKTYK